MPTLRRPSHNFRQVGSLELEPFPKIIWHQLLKSIGTSSRESERDTRRTIFGDADLEVLRYRDRVCDPFLPFERVSVAEAFAAHAGIDLLATIGPDGETDADGLRGQMAVAGVRTAEDDTWSDMLSRALSERVEPRLGNGRITVLDRYPAAEAALARPVAGDGRVAERFEVYACGVELANGFGELTNAGEQRRRFGLEMDEKERVYGTRYPLDEDFLAALDHMPAASGIALGFDRLVMLATGAPRIDDVIWVPVAE